jgi:hypothetical protein
MKKRKRLLYRKFLACAVLAVAAPFALNAQKSGEQSANKMDKLEVKRAAAQLRVDKAEADRRSADSLIALGLSLMKESDVEQEAILDEKDKLEQRVFKVELPAVEKQISSKDREEQAQGRAKKAEIRKEYNAEVKALQAKFAGAQKKKKEAKQSEMRGQEKKKLADKAWKDALAALKMVEKEIDAFEEAEKSKEREAQQALKKKENELAAKQQQREEAELKKQKEKEALQAKKEAEKAKALQEKEKKKSLEAAKREKEKAAQQKQQEKETAKREAEKAKRQKQTSK